MGRPLCVASIRSPRAGPPGHGGRVARAGVALPARPPPRPRACPTARASMPRFLRVCPLRSRVPDRARARPGRARARPPARLCHVSRTIGCFGAPALTGGPVLSGDRPDWVLPRVEMLGRGRFDHPRGTSTHNKRARRTCKRLICSTTRDRPVAGTSKVIPNRMGELTNSPPRRPAPPRCPRPPRRSRPPRPATPRRPAPAPQLLAARARARPVAPPPARARPAAPVPTLPRPAPRRPRCVIIERLNREPEPRRQHDHHLR